MRKRKHWEESPYYNTLFNFKWQPISKGIRFDLLSSNGQKQLVNHFEHHSTISTKDNLFRCLQKYCEGSVFDFVPMTFLLELNTETFKQDFEKFRMVFNVCRTYDEVDLLETKHNERMAEMNK